MQENKEDQLNGETAEAKEKEMINEIMEGKKRGKQFTSDYQPKGKRGRPKKEASKEALTKALNNPELKELTVKMVWQAVERGEPYAIKLVFDRIIPPLKAVTDPESLEGQFLQASIKEKQELEPKIKELEKLLEANEEGKKI